MTFPIWWERHKIPWFQTTNPGVSIIPWINLLLKIWMAAVEMQSFGSKKITLDDCWIMLNPFTSLLDHCYLPNNWPTSDKLHPSFSLSQRWFFIFPAFFRWFNPSTPGPPGFPPSPLHGRGSAAPCPAVSHRPSVPAAAAPVALWLSRSGVPPDRDLGISLVTWEYHEKMWLKQWKINHPWLGMVRLYHLQEWWWLGDDLWHYFNLITMFTLVKFHGWNSRSNIWKQIGPYFDDSRRVELLKAEMCDRSGCGIILGQLPQSEPQLTSHRRDVRSLEYLDESILVIMHFPIKSHKPLLVISII